MIHQGVIINKDLTQNEVKKILKYYPETGEMIWKINLSSRARKGSSAGHESRNGYTRITVNGNKYLKHRLIWLLVNGYNPENQIDHINRIKTDNRLCNLREVNNSCNVRNTGNQKNNLSGVKGVIKRDGVKGSKWVASISFDRKPRHLGTHDSLIEAVAHRLAAEQCLNWNGCNSSSPAFKYMKNFIKAGGVYA